MGGSWKDLLRLTVCHRGKGGKCNWKMEGKRPLLWNSEKFSNLVICSRTENRKSKIYLMNEMSKGDTEGAAWLPTMNREGKTEPQRVLGIHPRERSENCSHKMLPTSV